MAFLKWLFLPTCAICLQATLQPTCTFNSDLHTREKCAPYNQLGSGCWQLLRETGHKEAAEWKTFLQLPWLLGNCKKKENSTSLHGRCHFLPFTLPAVANVKRFFTLDQTGNESKSKSCLFYSCNQHISKGATFTSKANGLRFQFVSHFFKICYSYETQRQVNGGQGVFHAICEWEPSVVAVVQ